MKKKIAKNTMAIALSCSLSFNGIPQVLANEIETDPEDVIEEQLPALEEESPTEALDTDQTIEVSEEEEEQLEEKQAEETEETAEEDQVQPEEEQTEPTEETVEPQAETDYDGLPGLKGNFTRVENGYRLANTGGNNHNVSSVSAKAFSIDADIEFVAGNHVSLIFGAANAEPGAIGAFFGLELKLENDGLQIKLFQDNGTLGDGIIRYTSAGKAENKKAHLHVAVDENNELSIAVNGTPVTYTFAKDGFKNTYAGGYLGFLTWQSEAIISNIQYTKTEIPEANFKTNLVNLHGLQGTWTETEAGLLSIGSGDNFATSDSVAKNVEFSAKITNKTKNGAGTLAIRTANNPRDGGYFINADYSAKIFKLFSFPSGGAIASVPMSTVPENEDGSYEIKIQMVEDTIRVFVNGKGIIDVTDQQHKEAGKLGLLTFNSEVVYQDVVYKEIEQLDVVTMPELESMEILTEGVTITEAVRPEISIYGMDIPAAVKEIQLRPKANGKITAYTYDENWNPIGEGQVVEDILTLSTEDFHENFMNLVLAVSDQDQFEKRYTFTMDHWFTSEDLATEEWRPQFHVTPQTNFMNDPNGMVYDSTDGYWHMFYQYQPHNGGGGDQAWAHVRSKDLVNWEQMPMGIQRDEDGLIFSGSAIEDINNVSGFFTDNKEGESYLIAYFTYAGPAGQSQGMAYSKDHGVTWIKQGIILPHKENTISGSDFRDPKVFQVEGDKNHWYMITAGGAAQIFVSENLKDWTRSQNLTYMDGSRIESECPMMYPAIVEGTDEQVWIYGGSAGVYVVGKMEPDENGVYKWHAVSEKLEVESNEDPGTGYGKYATMTFYRPDDERTIGVSWLQDYTAFEGKGFQGIQSLPQSYGVKKINDKYVITCYPVDEVNALRDTETPIYSTEQLEVSKETTNILQGIGGVTYDLEGTFDIKDANEFGFRLRKNGNSQVVLKYNNTTHQMTLDLASAGPHHGSGIFSQTIYPDENGKIHLRLLIDQGAIEAFGNHGEANISTILYTPLANVGMEFFTDGDVVIDDLHIYDLKSMYSGKTSADTIQQTIALDAPTWVEPEHPFTINASIFPDKGRKGVLWEVEEGLEILEQNANQIVLKANEEKEYTIKATNQDGTLVKEITVDVKKPKFSNNIDGEWIAKGEGNSWSVVGDGVFGDHAGVGDSFYLSNAKVSPDRSFTYTGTITLEQGQAAGLVFSVKDQNNPSGYWYCGNIDTRIDGGIAKMFKNTGGQAWDVSKKLSEIKAENNTYRLKLEYNKETKEMTYTVNDVVIGSHAADFEGGYVGLITYHASAKFNDLQLVNADRSLLEDSYKKVIDIELAQEHTVDHFRNHIDIPAQVTLKYDDGTKEIKKVDWDTSEVQFGTPGQYKAYGTLVDPEVMTMAIEDPDLLANVTIKETDKTKLNEAIDQVAQLKPEDYTPESWGALTNALDAAMAVQNKADASQSEVDAAVQNVNNAIKALEKVQAPTPEVVDKSSLKSALDRAKALDSNNYTAESFAALQDASKAAQAVMDDENATQAQVDAAVQNVNAAIEALEKVQAPKPDIDKKALSETIKKANALKAKDYTKASYDAMRAALKEAQAVIEDENATQAQVDAAVKKLDTALKGLKKESGTSNQKTTRRSASTSAETGMRFFSVSATLSAAGAAILVALKRKKK